MTDGRHESSCSVHKQVLTKVNACVDEGVADLVEVLSLEAGLVTMESCQGGGTHDAYVIFRLGDWKSAGDFLFERLLPAMSPDLRAMCSLRIQAYDEETATATISIDNEAVAILTECVRNVISKTQRLEASEERPQAA